MERNFPRSLDSLEGIFAFIHEYFAVEGLEEERAYVVDLIAEELFTNMVKYNAESRTDVSVSLSRRDGRVVLDLLDPDGDHFDPTERPEVDVNASPEDRRPGGLGIHLVRKLAETVQYRHEGRSSRITVTVRAEDDDVRH